MTNELVMCPRGGRPCTLAHCPTSGCFLSPGSVRIGPNDVEVNVEKIYPAVWVPKHELEHAVKEKVAATQTAQALAAKVDRLQAVCAAAYQLAGAVGAPVRFLDALSDAASDELEARACTADLLPIGPLDCDAVRETRLEFDRALEREKFWMNQHDAREAEVEFARGIDAAARLVEQRLADYDAEHGSTDSDTGAREYPGTGDEYVYELTEIAEAIRGLAPPPAAPEPSEAEVEAGITAMDDVYSAHPAGQRPEITDQDRAAMRDALRAAAAARNKREA